MITDRKIYIPPQISFHEENPMVSHKSESTIRQYAEGLGAFAGATTAIVAPALAVGIGAGEAMLARTGAQYRAEHQVPRFTLLDNKGVVFHGVGSDVQLGYETNSAPGALTGIGAGVATALLAGVLTGKATRYMEGLEQRFGLGQRYGVATATAAAVGGAAGVIGSWYLDGANRVEAAKTSGKLTAGQQSQLENITLNETALIGREDTPLLKDIQHGATGAGIGAALALIVAYTLARRKKAKED